MNTTEQTPETAAVPEAPVPQTAPVPQDAPAPEAPRFSEETERKRKAAKRKRRRKKIVKWIIVTLVLLAIAGAAAYGIWHLFFKPEPKPEDITATSYRGSFSSSISGWGQVKASKTESVSIQARGELLELYVTDGDTVMEGDPLFVIDDKSLRDEIAARENEIETLREQRASSVKSMDGVAEGKTGIYKELDSINKKLASLTVTAPFQGRVIELPITADTRLSENTPIATFVDDTAFLLRLYYSYAFEDDIAVGNSATVSVPATMSVLQGKVTGIQKVRRITPEGAILFEVEVTIQNPGALTAGMIATAVLTDRQGGEITAYEDGKLEYVRTKTILSPADGNIVKFNLINYNGYSAGAVLLTISGDAYDGRISQLNSQIDGINEQLKGYEKQLETIDAQIAEKEKQIETLNGQFDAFNAVAPMSGTVMSVLAQPGSMVEAGSAVVTIADTSAMTVDISLDERDVTNVPVGTFAMLTQDTSTGQTSYFGTVTSVSLEGKYDYGYGYFPAVITIEGGEGLRSGSSMQYEIQLASKEDCLLVPINAVKYTEEGICVFVKDEGQEKPESAIELPEGTVPEGYWAVPVETGLSDESQIEIVSGIEEGATLFLSEGTDQNEMGMY